MCVLVCVAPPMVVGAWSMAGALQQLFDYCVCVLKAHCKHWMSGFGWSCTACAVIDFLCANVSICTCTCMPCVEM